jgi:hypothetical protein
MRLEERRTIVIVLISGVIGAVLFLPGVYFLGLWLAPPRPVPAASGAPPLLLEALWARADGGRATELRPVTPVNFVQHRACRALAIRHDDPRVRGERRAECLKSMPAVQGVDYLSTVHLQENHVEPRSFRMAIGQFATAVWLTRSWSREEFLNTLAMRGEFGFGWRGVHAAARGYFARPVTQLALQETALIASRVGDSRTDPWCEPEAAVDRRNGILTRMRDNRAISETDFQAASRSELGLAPPPEGGPRCKD